MAQQTIGNTVNNTRGSNFVPYAVYKDSQDMELANKIRLNMQMPTMDFSRTTAKDVGRFGLKTDDDVKNFLKTPAAKAEIAKFAKEKAISEAFVEERLFQMHLRQLLKLLLLAARKHQQKKKDMKQRELNSLIQHDIDLRVAKKHKEELKEQLLLTKTSSADSYLTILNQYDTEIFRLENLLDENRKNIDRLIVNIAKINEELHEIQIKYAIFNRGLDEIEQHLLNPVNNTPEALDQHIELLQQRLIPMEADISDNISASTPAVEQNISIYEQQSLLMQIEMGKTHRDVLSGILQYCTHEGEFTKDLRKAHSAIPTGTWVCTHNNEPLLAPLQTTPESMTPEQIHQGKSEFKARRTLRTLIKINENEEQSDKQKSLSLASLKLAEEQQKNVFLSKLLEHTQKKREKFINPFRELLKKGIMPSMDSSSTEMILEELGNIPPSPFEMTPMPKPKDPIKEFQQKLEEYQKTGRTPPTSEMLFQLVALLPLGQRAHADKFLQDQLDKMNISPKKTIPEKHASYIIRQLELYGLDAAQSRPDPLNDRKINEKQTAPRPSPFKNQI